ncbi:MAG: hypothetical protein GX456_07385 [Verrucomicrobia bacterium]|nr:hypothetical protein [Verrucomicrobiota bacterium]
MPCDSIAGKTTLIKPTLDAALPGNSQPTVTVPPKGGTLTAAGVASPDAPNNPSPLEFRVYAEHMQFTEQC